MKCKVIKDYLISYLDQGRYTCLEKNRLYKNLFFSAWMNGDEPEKKMDVEELVSFEEDATKPELLKKCRKLGLDVIPQDRPSSLKRLLRAYKLGRESS